MAKPGGAFHAHLIVRLVGVVLVRKLMLIAFLEVDVKGQMTLPGFVWVYSTVTKAMNYEANLALRKDKNLLGNGFEHHIFVQQCHAELRFYNVHHHYRTRRFVGQAYGDRSDVNRDILGLVICFSFVGS